jgi:hypothetical protein
MKGKIFTQIFFFLPWYIEKIINTHNTFSGLIFEKQCHDEVQSVKYMNKSMVSVTHQYVITLLSLLYYYYCYATPTPSPLPPLLAAAAAVEVEVEAVFCYNYISTLTTNHMLPLLLIQLILVYNAITLGFSFIPFFLG